MSEDNKTYTFESEYGSSLTISKKFNQPLFFSVYNLDESAAIAVPLSEIDKIIAVLQKIKGVV